jgi:hypothetical protein
VEFFSYEELHLILGSITSERCRWDMVSRERGVDRGHVNKMVLKCNRIKAIVLGEIERRDEILRNPIIKEEAERMLIHLPE